MTPEEHERLLNAVALEAPPDVKPDFNYASSHKNLSYGLVALMLCLITLVVAMRIFTRARLLRRLSLEDYFLLFAWLAYAAGYNTIVVKLAGQGVAVHQWNMTVRQLIEYLHLFHAGIILYNIVILPLKLSIIIQVLRAFVPSGSRDATYWIAHALIWSNVVFYIISTCLTIFACKPTAKSFDPTIQGGHCLNAVGVNIASASLNSLSDALLLILPQHVIWRLSLPRKRKLLLSIAFLGGILSFVSALVRLAYLVILDHSRDTTYYSGLVGLWSFPEIAFGFLVACLPVIRGFLNIIRGLSAVARIRALRAHIYSVFVRRRPSSDSSFTPTAAKEGARPLSNAAHLRYQFVGPHVSDVEYHELVVKSGNSWVTEEEAREQVQRPRLVAKPPQTIVRPQSHLQRMAPLPVQGEGAGSESRMKQGSTALSADPNRDET